jgi:hypothetical protein
MAAMVAINFWSAALSDDEAPGLMTGHGSDEDSPSEGDDEADNADESDGAPDNGDRAWEGPKRKKVRRPPRQLSEPLLRREEKQTTGARLRRRYDHRTEARTVAWVDSESIGMAKLKVQPEIYRQASEKFAVTSAGLVKKWSRSGAPRRREAGSPWVLRL